MIDIFCSLYSSIRNNYTFLEKIRFYSFLRFIIRILANLFLPFYFNITKSYKAYRIEDNIAVNNRIIVSLTSYPARINRLWLVIETLLRQSIKPDMIILWLSKDQFDKVNILPKKLLDLQKRGLVIKFVDGDIKSHKKYYYALNEFPDDIIITVDDDVFYQSDILETLIEAHRNNPKSICANHVRLFHDTNNIINYAKFDIVTKINSISEKYIQIGIGGVLYPPRILYRDALEKELFMHLAPMADDLWLYTMARLNGVSVFRTSYIGTFLPVINADNVSLSESNCNNNGNNIQLKNISEYYVVNRGVNPYLFVNN